jgi:hypothetical protein
MPHRTSSARWHNVGLIFACPIAFTPERRVGLRQIGTVSSDLDQLGQGGRLRHLFTVETQPFDMKLNRFRDQRSRLVHRTGYGNTTRQIRNGRAYTRWPLLEKDSVSHFSMPACGSFAPSHRRGAISSAVTKIGRISTGTAPVGLSTAASVAFISGRNTLRVSSIRFAPA